MNKILTFALLHSPLVGPVTWQLVHAEMERRAIEVITPRLVDHPDSTQPYWQQHAESVVKSLNLVPPDQRIILVAHSGAGPLLPIVRKLMSHSICAYVFVDAGIPSDNVSRLELMRLEDPEWADQFHHSLLQGGKFPAWNEEDLREVIPDKLLRRKMVAEVNPRSLNYFTEPIPVFSGWPDAPCAYIKFSESYEWDFKQARQAHWRLREVNAGHFHMLVDPLVVADMIVEVMQELGH
jgi:hypothetical protein